MKRYFNKIRSTSEGASSTFPPAQAVNTPQNEGVTSTFSSTPNVNTPLNEGTPPSSQNVFFNLELQSDPGLRKSIQFYDPNVRENVRRTYLQKGPCQPKSHDFPWNGEGRGKLWFVSSWFINYSGWLEYSVSKDAAYCLVHVKNTTSLSLKEGIDHIFSKHDLSISSLRGQGYDRASNMRGEFNGLKSLILSENSSAYYVHCSAHQLQLILVAVVMNHPKLSTFFEIVRMLTNIVGASCKHRDILREKQLENVVTGIACGEIDTGRGLNQERTLKRPVDTRWNSHYDTLVSLKILFSSVIDVLLIIGDDGLDQPQKSQADLIIQHIQCFEFIFLLHLMQILLGMTNELSQALQKKDQEIVNAMHMVKTTKGRLQKFREDGWDSFLSEVYIFCAKEDIDVLHMEDPFVNKGRSRRKSQAKTNLHHYRVELFCTVIDDLLGELGSRFNEMNMELLLCVACLDPRDSFIAFDTRKLIRLAEFYPSDFSSFELVALEQQLENYIADMRSDERIGEIDGISDLCRTMIRLRKHHLYPMVFSLIKLALLLPVATATVERVFSAMKIIKSQLRNRLGDDLMNSCLINYIEKDVFELIDIELVIQRFQNMKSRRESL